MRTRSINPNRPFGRTFMPRSKKIFRKHSWFWNRYTGTDVGRATQGATLGLLAKVVSLSAEMGRNFNAICVHRALGLYALEKVYKNNFIDSTQNNTESLFEVQHLSNQSPKLGSHLNQYFSPPKDNGYYFDAPLQDFVNEFEKTNAMLLIHGLTIRSAVQAKSGSMVKNLIPHGRRQDICRKSKYKPKRNQSLATLVSIMSISAMPISVDESRSLE